MSAEYELTYHGLAGRGEFVRVIFEDAGVPFKDISDVQKILAIKEGKEEFYPSFAPPFLRKGERVCFWVVKVHVCVVVIVVVIVVVVVVNDDDGGGLRWWFKMVVVMVVVVMVVVVAVVFC